ncbi:hypothetical protein SUGI_0463610 [Cryptomeria japonica]|uniref:uncharacterized protein LOC131067399 n=1 Tax=Cryptomeria japonica TaxID=3369 RepID=UPI00240898A9|nr:uncharacterized protein LOC131067399 [Cryptomeria japonica]GLJ24300.1 hypothetical protein SUGI_0463610 [Cryptomeria japonica]
MGATSSSREFSTEERETKELESCLAGSGVLSMLQTAFFTLAGSSDKNSTNFAKASISASALEECFRCRFLNFEAKDYSVSAEFPKLLGEISATIVSTHFTSDNGQVFWPAFLKGYDKCCKKTPVALSINLLIRLFHDVRRRTDIPSNIEISEDDDNDKFGGHLSENDICDFLWFCWVMEHNAKYVDFCDNKMNENTIKLPDIKCLVSSAIVAFSGSNLEQLHIEDSKDTRASNIEIPVQSLYSWILATIPGLAYCLPQYVENALQRTSLSSLVPVHPSSQTDEVHSSGQIVVDSGLLTSGTAWAIALSFRPSLGGGLLMTSFMSVSHSKVLPDLVYRSSQHGKGMNRFWSQVDGYNGPLLVLISGSSMEEEHDNLVCRKWIIGAFTNQGFENKDSFYGSFGCLFAVKPIFRSFLPDGRDKNFVYSHLHPLGRVYEPRPKPVGIAFGGTLGSERVFLDEDFAKITIRHHTVDKTYHAGYLVPGQEYLTLEASVLDVEAWGFGGKVAEQEQAMHKQREQLFTEQRRKVDLKTFGNWEDSPEKMMMGLMSNPDRVKREDR